MREVVVIDVTDDKFIKVSDYRVSLAIGPVAVGKCPRFAAGYRPEALALDENWTRPVVARMAAERAAGHVRV